MNYMTPLQAASYVRALGLPCEASTLAKLRVTGGGPRFHKFGQRVRYCRDELDTWISNRLGKPLSSTSTKACE